MLDLAAIATGCCNPQNLQGINCAVHKVTIVTSYSSATDVSKALIVHRGTAIRGGESAGRAGTT